MKGNMKQLARKRRHLRVRARVSGTTDIPRLCLSRSNSNLYAQLIDDEKSQTILGVSSLTMEKSTRTEKAKILGTMLAKEAKTKGVEKVVFDRCGNQYIGAVKAFAESAREGGLIF